MQMTAGMALHELERMELDVVHLRKENLMLSMNARKSLSCSSQSVRHGAGTTKQPGKIVETEYVVPMMNLSRKRI